jgi:hypothetical protein
MTLTLSKYFIVVTQNGLVYILIENQVKTSVQPVLYSPQTPLLGLFNALTTLSFFLPTFIVVHG